jgi:hypothetical protein
VTEGVESALISPIFAVYRESHPMAAMTMLLREIFPFHAEDQGIGGNAASSPVAAVYGWPWFGKEGIRRRLLARFEAGDLAQTPGGLGLFISGGI